MLFFFFGRMYFLLFNFQNSSGLKIPEVAGAFSHGLLLDISTTGYYLLIPFLLSIPALFTSVKWYAFFLKIYTIILAVFTSIIIVTDANLYTYWGFRMDYTPLFYLKTPAEAMASVKTLTMILLGGVTIIIAAAFIAFYNRLLHYRFSVLEKTKSPVVNSFIFLFLTAALIIPIRGGFGVAPINAGSVYFSENMFANHAAINAVWNVGTTAVTQKPVDNPYVFSSQDEAGTIVDSLYTANSSDTVDVLKLKRPDIILIILESFSSYIAGPSSEDSLVTTNLNRFAKEGIFFSNLYASGTRTDKALPAILNGYPAQPAQSIIKEPRKTQSLSSLVRILLYEGYNSSFWYGGEINFANFNSFVIASGFKEIITKSDFPANTYNSKWGVHDHILMNAFRESFSDVQEPFLKVLLTLSSHEPFEVPAEPVFPGNDDKAKYRNSVHYTDKALGEFLDWSKEQPWWNNTLIILVADHGARISQDMEPWSDDVFRIPMVWTGGALSSKALTVTKTGNQTDIAKTLLRQMDIDSIFPFSKDLLDPGSKSFSFYTFNEGFGFINDSSAVAYDHKARMKVWQTGKDNRGAERAGKALLQVTFKDYLER